jgi:hypothetical protein
MTKSARDTLTQIILWNAVPYLGVFLWDWSPIMVPVCYLLESVILGGFTVFKLIIVSVSGNQENREYGLNSLGLVTVPIFILSYSLVLTFLFYGLFAALGLLNDGGTPFSVLSQIISKNEMLLLLTSFIVLHGYSFVADFFLSGYYKTVTVDDQFVAPFYRAVVVHFIIFIGGLLYVYTKSGLGVLVVLTIIKAFVEWIHLTSSDKKYLAER